VLYEKSMTIQRPLVSIVDDDESVRESLPDLLQKHGSATHPLSSAEEFLASDCLARTECLILDITMPGMSGLHLQSELGRRSKAFRLSSLPLNATRKFDRDCWRAALWSVCSNLSAILHFWMRSGRCSPDDDRLGAEVLRIGMRLVP
jgi:response regulator RpfG family c-di-GMP phosphodiesterase